MANTTLSPMPGSGYTSLTLLNISFLRSHNNGPSFLNCCVSQISSSAAAFAAMATISATTAFSGKRIAALDNAAWKNSAWISAADAPVATGSIGGTNERAADGASWFVSTVRNENKVASAPVVNPRVGGVTV